METSAASFGDVLRRLRLAAALSQEELAERAGLSARAISDLERGLRQGPRPESLRLLADALSLPREDREALFAAAHRAAPSPADPGPARGATSLPQPATPLVGRDQDRAALCALLAQPEVRLVTLTGMGGIGKTHLAIAVASGLRQAFRDGIVFVDLAPLTEPAHVIPTVATALGIRDAPGAAILRTVIAALREKRMLLVLDNCEQVLEGAPQIAELIASCPALTVLATSREALRLRGEREWPVAPLPLPDLERLPPLAEMQQSPAITLFTMRAQASDPRFSLTGENALAVATVCHRVDGVPLAIELAAARVKLLSPEALAVRLEQRLSLLTSGARDAPARQRTLRDALAWSYDLLSPSEQALFRRLGIFVGGWTLEAAEAVADPDHDLNVLDALGSLLDKSLVRIDARGVDERYGMFETVREFALEQLDREGERAATWERHAGYFLELAERGSPEMLGADQKRWLGSFEREHPNLREALATLDARGDAGYPRLTNALAWFWFLHCHAVEGLPHCVQALSREPGATPGRARALHSAGMLAYACGDYANAERWLQEGEALARALGQERMLADALLTRGAVAEHLGDEASAQHFFEAGYALAQEAGNVWMIGVALSNLSDAAYRRGDLEQAEQFALKAIPVLQASRNAYMESMNSANIAQVALARGESRRAARALQDGLALAEEIESRWNVANVISGAAAVCAALERWDQAARLLGAADAQRMFSGHPRLPQFHLFAQTQNAVRARLGVERFQVAWDAGRILSGAEAVAAARAVIAEAIGSEASLRTL
jgi:predicted ATPase/transcriptional regulator with XRE-family HTH domain